MRVRIIVLIVVLSLFCVTARAGAAIDNLYNDISAFPANELTFLARPGLQLQNVSVTEKLAGQSRTQTINSLECTSGAACTPPSLNIVLVIDRSGSMETDNLIGVVKAAAINFCNKLTSSDRIKVLAFDTTASTTSGFVDKLSAISFINSISAGGGTALYDSLSYALDMSNDMPNSAVIAFSDGDDNSSAKTMAQIAGKINNYRKQVYLVFATNNVQNVVGETVNSHSLSCCSRSINDFYSQCQSYFDYYNANPSTTFGYSQGTINSNTTNSNCPGAFSTLYALQYVSYWKLNGYSSGGGQVNNLLGSDPFFSLSEACPNYANYYNSLGTSAVGSIYRDIFSRLVSNVGYKLRYTANPPNVYGLEREVTVSDIASNPVEKAQSIYTDGYVQHKLVADFYPAVPGRAVNLRIDPPFPASYKIKWTVKKKLPAYNVTARINGTQSIANISNIRGNGWLTVEAKSTLDSKFRIKGAIPVGCNEECKTRTCGARLDWVQISSIDFGVSLGRGSSGYPSGYITLASESASPDNYKIEALELFSFGEAYEEVVSYSSERIFIGPEFSLKAVTVSDYSFNIYLYRRTSSCDQSGIPLPDATPEVFWTVENPNQSMSVYNVLKITENKDGSQHLFVYEWDQMASTWTLTKGDDSYYVATKEYYFSPSDVVEHLTEHGSASDTASDVSKTYSFVEANGQLEYQVTREAVNTGVGEDITITNYYGEPHCAIGSCGQIESIYYSNGYWLRFVYDGEGRKIVETSPYLSSGETTRTNTYDYSSLSAEDSQLDEDKYFPRTITRSVGSQIIAIEYNMYHSDENGRTEINEIAAGAANLFGDSANVRTTKAYYPIEAGPSERGRIKSVAYPDGRQDSYYYSTGSYQAGQPGNFSEGEGTDSLETIVHGTIGAPSGIQAVTTIEKRIKDMLKRQLAEITYLYQGDVDAILSWRTYTYSPVENSTITIDSNGDMSESSNGCCQDFGETDKTGIVTNYTYDELGRTASTTKSTRNGEVITSYTYDAAGRIIVETVANGAISVVTRKSYYNDGRLRSVTDAEGKTVNISYSGGGRITNKVYYDGTTEIIEYYSDGSIKSNTGSAVINKYFEYGVNADGSQWTKTFIGPDNSNSQVWEKTTTDMFGHIIKSEKPGSEGVEAVFNFYNSRGQLIKTSKPNVSDILYMYDDLGRLLRTGFDVNGSGTLELASVDRIQDSSEAYLQIDSDWWRQSQYTITQLTMVMLLPPYQSHAND